MNTSDDTKPMKSRAETYRERLLSLGFGWLVSLAVLAVGVFGFMGLLSFRQPPAAQPALDTAPLVLTMPLKLTSGPVEVVGSGFVSPVQEVALAFRVTGVVSEISPALEPGSKVEAGDMLVRLDQRRFEAALAQAIGDKETAEADLAFQVRQIERTRQLKQGGFAAEERIDELISLRDQAKARIARLEGLVLERRLDLEFATLTAPFTGRIISESAAAGAIVQTGSEIARLYATDQLEVTTPMESRQAALINGLLSAEGEQNETPPGAEISVRYAGRTYSWEGFVFGARPDIVSGTRTVDVNIRVPNPEAPGALAATTVGDRMRIKPPTLRPGMYATVSITGQEVEDQAILPRRVLRLGRTLWTVTPDNRLKVVPVTIITERGDDVTVEVPGVPDGTPIVVSSLPFQTEGMRLRIAEPDGPEDGAGGTP